MLRWANCGQGLPGDSFAIATDPPAERDLRHESAAILNDTVSYALPDPAYFFFPGVTVFLLVLSFNLLGDGLRDALDPKAGRQ